MNTPTGIVYTSSSGLGQGWDDPSAAERAFRDALQGHFDTLGWDLTVKRGEGATTVEGLDERDVAYEVERVFAVFCVNDGDADATLAALAN